MAQPTRPECRPHLRPDRSASGGFTLLELATALTILALALGNLLPAARNQLHRMAVRGAREEVAGLFHRARMEAVAQGSAELFITAKPPRVELWSGSALLARADLEEDYGVTVTLSRDRREAKLRYDGLGLGRVASQTILLARGEAEARLVVSSYGRVSKP